MPSKRRETLAAQGMGRVAEPFREIVQPIHAAHRPAVGHGMA